jgi:hypothetical protein
MNSVTPNNSAGREGSTRPSRVPWILAACGLLVVLLGLLGTHRDKDSEARSGSTAGPPPRPVAESTGERFFVRPSQRGLKSGPGTTAEDIVTNKVAQFARERRGVAHAMAREFKVEVPADVERFFDAAEAGRWEDLTNLFKAISGNMRTDARTEGLIKLWPAVSETYGVAEIARDWPAQKLLDYGQAVLGSLRPGMAYVGGTDPGRYIPTLLNETAEGERHIVLTQNAFADGTYLQYASFLYGDRMATLTSQDSQRAFQDYLTDAQQRLQHDQQFPNEPKQLRAGEDVRVTDNLVQVSGQVAVMSINEKLLQALLQKNPNLTFALEESFPLESTYAGAVPLGPIMELRAPDAPNAFTAERAAQSVDYWRDTAQRLATDPEAPPDSDTRKAYAQMAMAQANLLASHSSSAEAEQTYRLAHDLAPGFFEPIGQLSRFLARAGRAEEAVRLLDNFGRNHADQLAAVQALRGTLGLVVPPAQPSRSPP